jgi:hypothetical protein
MHVVISLKNIFRDVDNMPGAILASMNTEIKELFSSCL